MGTGEQSKITITNDKGRLSQEEIERMISDAEKFKVEDEKEAGRIQAKNSLESYVYQMKSTIGDEKKVKISEEGKKELNAKIDAAIAWMEENENAAAEEYKEKMKEIEQLAQKHITPAAGGAGGPQAAPEAQKDDDIDDLDNLD